MKHIEITFRVTDGRYVFATADGKIRIENVEREKATAVAICLVAEMRRKRISCRIEAYAPLGPALKLLRDAGAICRIGPQRPPSGNSAKWQMPNMPVKKAGTPAFSSWADYIASTSERERMARCRAVAKRANRKRLLSDEPTTRLSAHDVWHVMEAAHGRCVHCGSLAVERRPSYSDGSPIKWAQIGRRVGSLEHLKRRCDGGGNELLNLAWCCLWCNTWPSERRPHAADHGGYHQQD